jgi:signal transduction histidine kinase
MNHTLVIAQERSSGLAEHAVIEAQDNERARIARELHDSVGQKIALLQMALGQIAGAMAADEHRARLLEVRAQVADVARELHDISYELHPLRLRLLGLPKTLAALCREITQESAIDVTFSGDESVAAFGAHESLCLYRIAQEALHNAVKHSGAARASVQLVRRGDTVLLIVSDSGRGFDVSRPGEGLGLTSMRQRAQFVHGTFDVQSARGRGTRICATVPLPQDRH